jgi:hypothetical protein
LRLRLARALVCGTFAAFFEPTTKTKRMNSPTLPTRLALRGVLAAWLAATALAHETGTPHGHETLPAATPLPFRVEAKTPIKGARVSDPGVPTSGQGAWTFVAASGLVPVPEAARPHLKGAHGTLVVDAERDVVYWGLENVGWIAFRDGLTRSEVVQGDPRLARGNLHGADLLPRRGRLPLVVAADNVEGHVYLSDTTFREVRQLGVPPGGPYADGKGYAPTDAAFISASEIWVTDGYGRAYFMPAGTDPLAFRGAYYGGKAASQTPHGITFDPRDKSLLIAARPEARLQRWSPKREAWLAAYGLPPGSTVCDVDLWGDYALAPCLDGPNNSPGPIYVINLRKRAIVSTLKPKEELGYAEAQHIHDACWYVRGKGAQRELYVVFTAWNPGGIGALKLVRRER